VRKIAPTYSQTSSQHKLTNAEQTLHELFKPCLLKNKNDKLSRPSQIKPYKLLFKTINKKTSPNANKPHRFQHY